MSINIGSAACDAAQRLHANSEWKAIREGLYEVMRRELNKALDTNTPDAVGYARALRDMYVAFESATTAVPVNQVKKPTTEKH